MNLFLVDTEAVRKEDIQLMRRLAVEHAPFAVVSLDGDSDRPWLSDEKGEFLRGDMLGVLTALYLGADAAAIPVSSNDAADQALTDKLTLRKTRIGSPYVIRAMQDAQAKGFERVVGWEVNGGFLTQSDLRIGTHILQALPTRDSVLPLLCAMLFAIKENKSLSELIADLSARFTHADRIKEFPVAISQQVISTFSPADETIDRVDFGGNHNSVLQRWQPEKDKHC